MKKRILIIDIVLLIITAALLVYYECFSHSYGLAALEEVGKAVVCLFSLGAEIIILIVLIIMWLYGKVRK